MERRGSELYVLGLVESEEATARLDHLRFFVHACVARRLVSWLCLLSAAAFRQCSCQVDAELEKAQKLERECNWAGLTALRLRRRQ